MHPIGVSVVSVIPLSVGLFQTKRKTARQSAALGGSVTHFCGHHAALGGRERGPKAKKVPHFINVQLSILRPSKKIIQMVFGYQQLLGFTLAYVMPDVPQCLFLHGAAMDVELCGLKNYMGEDGDTL